MEATEVRKVIRAVRQGLITEAEGIIELAALAGVDARCDMGECIHAPRE